jgi:RecJ-like exonuclease
MIMMMMSMKEAIETAMDIEACPACGDTGRIEVYIEHTDTDKTLFVDECNYCGALKAREESN